MATILQIFALLVLFTFPVAEPKSLQFKYPKFVPDVVPDFVFNVSEIALGAIQVTPDNSDPLLTMNRSGRALFKHPLHLWKKGNGNTKITTTFNSTFKLNISPLPNAKIPLGEGVAFVLTSEKNVPENSQGEWLGIVNERTNGTREAAIFAVEFDTRKSSSETNDNHVGLNLNGIDSIVEVSLSDLGFNLSNGENFTVRIQYDGKNISVFFDLSNVIAGTDMNTPILTWPINLSEYLPEKVYVGFSGSTGDNVSERNCILSWEFRSSDIGEARLLWPWIAVPGAVVLLVVIGFFMCLKRRCFGEDFEEAYPRLEEEIQGSSMAPKKFKLRELKAATENFNPKNKLGKGGFGTVYKGKIGAKIVAVKRVSKHSKQGKQEFVAEVTTIGTLSHRNLVKLIGWCYESKELLIVYEFMPNGSLEKYLFGGEKTAGLTWEKRRNVIFGVGEALNYLHNGSDCRVLHRDVKPSNVMLDSEFNPKLGDFGLARAIKRSEKTHHSTREIAGTPGYMAPESFFTGRATVETDVYAFGVLILEVASGRQPGTTNEENAINNGLVFWIWRLYSANRVLEAVDKSLDGEFDEDEMTRFLALGLGCCHPNPAERPSMRTILKVLNNEEDPPELPVEIPAFVWDWMPPSFKSEGDTTLQGGQLSAFTEITGR